MKNSVAVVSTFALFWVYDAQAYLDPGTGSIIIQSLIAAIVGGAYTIKTYWYKIKLFFSSREKRTDSDQEN